MNGMRRRCLIAGMLVALVLQPSLSNAQYSADYQTNIISGLTSNWVDNPANGNAGYVVGSNWVYDALVVDDGGALSNGFGYIGYAVGADNNSVLVSDPGSVWSNSGPVFVGYSGAGNQLTITNGGVVSDSAGLVGWNASSSNNSVLVSGLGSEWKNTGEIWLGSLGPNNQVFIMDGGAMYTGQGFSDDTQSFMGYGNSNTVLVTGSGSVWGNTNSGITFTSAGNRLIVANGGSVYSRGPVNVGGSNNTIQVTGNGSVLNSIIFINGRSNEMAITDGGVVIGGGGIEAAGASSPRGDTVLVSGIGSVWSNSSSFSVGSGGVGNQLIITNGGEVYDQNGYISGSASSNVVLVSGNGALWQNQGSLSVGYDGFDSQLQINTGGSVVASVAYIGGPYGTEGNQIIVSGGALTVTNALGTGALNVEGGTLTINCGTVNVDQLVANSGTTNSIIAFNGGVLCTKGTTVSNGFVFTVGNGSSGATLTLATGGTGFHSFANGLAISSNGVLNGIGTVIGATTVNAGGTLAPGDGPGSITFSNNLTLAAGSTLAVTLNGTGAGQYDQIIGLGSAISISNCVLSVRLGYTPSPGDSFTIISNFTSMAVLGTFVTTDGAALPNGAEFQVNGTTFEIDYAANCDGLDVALMALIPEPSTFLLSALGGVSLVAFLRRKRA